MPTVTALKVVYQTTMQSWQVELTLEDGATHRIPMPGPDVDAIVRAFGGASETTFDPEAREIAFLHEPMDLQDLLGFPTLDDDNDDVFTAPPTHKKGRRRR